MKRDPRLHGLSSDHHRALVLARHAARAAARGGNEIAIDREEWEKTLTRFEGQVLPHFAIEEQLLLPALHGAGEVDLVRRTLDEHAALRQCLAGSNADGSRPRLARFARLLEAHVRFEERELFDVAQVRLGSTVLDRIREVTSGGEGHPRDEEAAGDRAPGTNTPRTLTQGSDP